MKKKQLIIGGILLIIFVITVILIFNYKPLEKQKNNISNNNSSNDDITNNINQEQNINNIIFTNITCKYDGNISILEYTVINKTKKVVNLGLYEIKVKNKDGEVIANMVNELDQDIQPNEEINTANSIDIDLTKANSIELVLEESE